MADVPSHAFASDNAAPAHPKVIDAIVAANDGAVASYGNDPVTHRAAEAVKAAFDSPDAEVLFALTGTAANVIALASAVRPWQEILCSDIAHSLVDEAGGPVRLSGAQLTRLPSDDGLIDPAALDAAVARRGPVHHSQRALSPSPSPPRTAASGPHRPSRTSSTTPTISICSSTSTAPASATRLPRWASLRRTPSPTPTSSPSAAPRTAC